ncbi:MAG: hypothetical protein Greene041662_1065 [Candidatus Peregrinibacteria bacterium Greene0416_62]|nr:MAG: hypothetical protein Greene041662_1065 [Candidatus Peregrinibacteria bacterium Greene0416_62]
MHRSQDTNWLFIATVFILAVGIAVRIVAAFQPLWLDEIWSMMFLDRIEHAWDVLSIHHLNNHPLNTLYLWLLGPSRMPILYRIPSLLSGIALTLWMTRVSWKRSQTEGFFVAVFIGLSLVILQTAVEARGYSPMLLAAFAAYVFFQRMERTEARQDIIFYAFFASLAVTLHLSAITVILAAAAATFVRGYFAGMPAAFRKTLRLHSVPFLVFGLLVIFTYHQQAFDGGQDPGVSFSRFGADVLGWPSLPLWAATAVSYGVVIALLAVVEHLLRKDPPQGIFLLMLFCIAPVMLVVAGSHSTVHPITFGTVFSIDNVIVEYVGNTPDKPPSFLYVRKDAWEEHPPEWLLDRQFVWESVRQAFLRRVENEYEIVLPAAPGQWWVVWRRKGL